jgi:hypothetical protein
LSPSWSSNIRAWRNHPPVALPGQSAIPRNFA